MGYFLIQQALIDSIVYVDSRRVNIQMTNSIIDLLNALPIKKYTVMIIMMMHFDAKRISWILFIYFLTERGN